ncbi:hypothetical protein [Streptomyces sp. NPDC006309]|uniref:hypothetical protein n=1 Tax=Streptomyces sp. NPDC006309 TaxID=3156749 RepID=UPI0033B64719
MPGHESSRPKTATLDVEKAKEKAKAVSSQIYELIGIRTGKATQPGPSISTCDQDPEHLYKTVHPWSSPTAGREKDPKILVNVVSGCWRAPKGTDLGTQY